MIYQLLFTFLLTVLCRSLYCYFTTKVHSHVVIRQCYCGLDPKCLTQVICTVHYSVCLWFAARVASSSKGRTGSKLPCHTTAPSNTCGRPSPPAPCPTPDCILHNSWTSSPKLADLMKHHILFFSTWEDGTMSAKKMAGLLRSPYLRVSEPLNGGQGNPCAVKTITFDAGNVDE